MSERTDELAANLRAVQERVAAACARAGRSPASVRLIAVSKTKPIEDVRAALEAGQRAFGENYAQELVEKTDALTSAGAQWHFIGALQTNKVKFVAGRAALVHTCDRLSLAKELAKRARALSIVQRVLVEVNVGAEPQKGGCAVVELPGLMRAIAGEPALRCEGLMCIPPAEGDPRPHFRKLRELRDELLARGTHPGPLAELSMGMSADYEIAIEEGATLVRVGTAIFGARERHEG